jgi:hypothetical protein
MALHGLLPWRDRETFAVDARVDDDVEGPFKTFLVARRKKKTSSFRGAAEDGSEGSETVCPRVENHPALDRVGGTPGESRVDRAPFGEGKEKGSFRGVVAGRRASRWRVVGGEKT